ncbi:type IV secretion system protein [Kocuria rosea]|uniref:type IV secretion system protein n=1 Tax=Kocuria rosea TaxID=1275 RepID=UPI0011A9E51E|nr:type IV secretion system protein [Kocuria rosea]
MSPRSFALTAKTSDYTVDVVGDSSPTPAPRGRKRITQAFSALLIAMFLAMAGLLTSGSSANAAWIDGAVRGVLCSNIYFNTDPDSVWGGPNTTKGMPKDTSDNHGAVKGYEITAYEKYGVSGTNWTVWSGPDNADEMKNEGDMGGRQLVTLAGGDNKLDSWASMNDGPEDQRVFYNADESCGDPVNQGWTLAGNLIMTVNGAVVWLTGFVFQTAYESASSIIHSLDDTIVTVVETLTSALYFELFEVMVMLAALWMGYVGLVKRKSTQMAQGALWMFGAAFLGGLMLANPMAVSNTVNGVVSKVSETAISTISKTGVDPLSKDAQLCAVDEAGNSFAPAGEDKPDPVARGTVRVMQCSMWQNFMFNPWVIGQFGHAPGQADGVDYIAGDGETPGNYGHISTQTPVLKDAEIPTSIKFGDRDVDANWALLQLDSKVSYPGADNVEQGKHMLHVASAQTFEDAANPEWAGNRTWAGQSSLNRVMVAIISFIGLIGTAIMLVVISMEIIVLQIGLVILTLLAPIFALIAVHPGMGRRIALMYVNTVVELALRRIVLSVMLAVMIAFYAAVIHASQSADWLVSMILMVAVSIGGIMYKNKILQMFSGAVNMGGAGKMNMGDGITDNILGKAGNIGGTAAAVALAAGTGGLTAGATHLAGKAGAGVKAATSHEGSFVGVGQRPQARKDGESSRKETDAPTSSGTSEEGPATMAGARPMDRVENEDTAPIPVVAEAPQEDVEATPERPAVQAMDEDALEPQEDAEEVAPRPEAEAGALPLVEEAPEVQAGARPDPLHSGEVAPTPTTVPVAPVAATAAAGAGAAVAGARSASETAPRPAGRPAAARRPLARKAATPRTVRKGLPHLRVLPGGASSAPVRSVVKDSAVQAKRKASVAAAVAAGKTRTPVMGMVHTIPSVASVRAAVEAKANAPVNAEAPVAPRKAAPKSSRAGAGAPPEVQGPVVAAQTPQTAAPAAQSPKGGLPDLSEVAPPTAPAAIAPVAAPQVQATRSETVPAPQPKAPKVDVAPSPTVTSKAQASQLKPKAAPKATAPKPETVAPQPTLSQSKATPKGKPAAQPKVASQAEVEPAPRLSTKDELRARAVEMKGGKERNENPTFRQVVARGSTNSVKEALSGDKGKKGRRLPASVRIVAAGLTAPNKVRQEAIEANRKREAEVDALERGLGIDEVRAVRVYERQRNEGGKD